jgi:hypothetical protein
LFELRGIHQPEYGQQVLVLKKSGSAILPAARAENLTIAYRMQTLKRAKGVAILRPEGSGFPIVSGVIAEFFEHSSMGGEPGVKTDHCFFDVGPGQQPHWLMFDRGERSTSHFKQRLQYMLEAADFVSIVQALRDDIHDYATAINADEQKIGPLSTAIDAFVKANTKPTT